MVRIPDCNQQITSQTSSSNPMMNFFFEVRKDAVPDLIEVATQSMEKADRPVVAIEPGLVVDSGVGKNWLEAH